MSENVDGFKPGDRVISAFHPRRFGGKIPDPETLNKDSYGTGRESWLTELKAVSQEAIAPLPNSLTYEEGFTLTCAGATAWNALMGSTLIRKIFITAYTKSDATELKKAFPTVVPVSKPDGCPII